MKRRNEIQAILLLVICFSISLFTNSVNETKAAETISYWGYLTDRFTEEGVENVYYKLHLFGENEKYLEGSDGYTDENGRYGVAIGIVDWFFWAAILEIVHPNYCNEYYELGNNAGDTGLVNHNITPVYTCTLYGYVKNRVSPYPPIQGATVKIYGVDYHDTVMLYGTTTTNAQGYYCFSNLNFDKEYPDIMEVPIYYYIKITKAGYIPVTKTITYPCPYGNINLGTVKMRGYI